jgi:hypothetical protein
MLNKEELVAVQGFDRPMAQNEHNINAVSSPEAHLKA